MSDLNYVDRDLEVKIVGQDASGNTVNYVSADVNGNLLVKDYSNGPVTPGAVASVSSLIGGQFNTSLPTLTNTQQSSVQLDSSGRLIIRPLTSSDVVSAVQSGTWTVQPGNTPNTVPWLTTDTADGPVTPGAVATKSNLIGGQFNTSLPTLTNTQQSAIQLDASGRLIIRPLTSADVVSAVQSGTWNIGTITSITNPVAVTQSGTWTVQQGTPPWVVSHLDIAPANQTITALDTGTSSLVGANGQTFYFGTTTTNSTALYSLSSVENVTIQANLLGSGGTMVVEISMDGGSFWLRPNVYQISTQSYTNGFTSPFIATVNTTGMTNIRVRSTVSWSGTATIIVKESLNNHSVTIGDSLPSGTNTIGAVTQAAGPWTVQGDSASGATKAGNPVQIGGVFNTTQPTVTTGQTVEVQSTARGGLIVSTGVDSFNINNITGTITNPTGAATAANQATEITSLQLIDNVVGPVTPGTVATNSWLIGAQFNTSLPTLANTQQAAVQVDSSGRLLVGSIASALPAGSNNIGSVNQGTSPWVVAGNAASGSADSGNPVKVGGIYNSTAVTLTNGQRGDVQVDVKSRVQVVDTANIGTGVQSAITVTNAAIEVKVGASRLVGRSFITAYNNGTQTIFWGYTSGVTVSSGTPLVVNQVGSWRVGDAQSIYLIATSGSQNVRISEV